MSALDDVDGIVPHHDLDAEAAVLSAVLLDPNALARIPELRAEQFFSRKHRTIFEAVRAVAVVGIAVDTTTVAAWLKDRGRLGEVGGVSGIGEILDSSPAITNVGAHAEIVARKADARDLALELARLAANARRPGFRAEEAVRRIEEVRSRAAAERPQVDDLIDVARIFAPLPPVPHVAVGLDLCPGAPSMIGGYGFSGKTVSGQALLLAVALGRCAWGCADLRVTSAPAIHFDYEQGERLTRERYQRLARAMGATAVDLDGRLRVCPYPKTYLDDPAAEEFYLRRIDGAGIALVDSFRAGLVNGDENDSRVRRYLDMLGRVSERSGCTIVVIHHARKPRQGEMGGARAALRGSGAIFDACNSVLVLEATEKGEPAIVHHEKARTSGRTHEPFALVIEDVDVAGEQRAGLRVDYRAIEAVAEHRDRKRRRDASALDRRVLDAVEREPGLQRTSVVRALNVNKQRGLDAVRDLLDRRLLEEGPRGGLYKAGASPRFYGSPPKEGGTGTGFQEPDWNRPEPERLRT
jgi:hypothetical protein